jgi:hypothetical protein
LLKQLIHWTASGRRRPKHRVNEVVEGQDSYRVQKREKPKKTRHKDEHMAFVLLGFPEVAT